MAGVQNKEDYTNYCNEAGNISLFHQPWWLNAVCGGLNWDVVSYEEPGKITAFLPFYIKKKAIIKGAVMPPATPYLGPVFKVQPGLNQRKRGSLIRNATRSLVTQLSPYDYTHIQCAPGYGDHLSFYWEDFRQTVKYTHRILVDEKDALWNLMSKNTRKHITKAEKKWKVVETQIVEDFIPLYAAHFAKKNIPMPLTGDRLRILDDQLVKRNQRRIFSIVDDYGKMLTALYVVHDDQYSYHLLTGTDFGLRDNDAGTLNFWEAIKWSMDRRLRVDFVGSMIAGVVEFQLGFNPEIIGYHSLKKSKNKIIQTLKA